MQVGLVYTEDVVVQAIRDEQYEKELAALGRDSAALRESAELMEQELLLSGGFPQGSCAAEPLLLSVTPSDWELVLWALDLRVRHTARRALEFLPQQRIYHKRGLSIVYMVVRNEAVITIYLGALTSMEPYGNDILWKFLKVNP